MNTTDPSRPMAEEDAAAFAALVGTMADVEAAIRAADAEEAERGPATQALRA